MGNNHSREGSPKHGISRNNSGSDLQEKIPSQLLPIDKLAKLLTQKTLEEDSIENGISVSTFTRYLFPKYPVLGQRLFHHWQMGAGVVNDTGLMSPANFRAQADKLMSVMVDDQQIQMYVTMYAENSDTMQTEQFHNLLLTVYKIAMDHYPDGPQSCRQLFKTLQAVVDSAFHKKESLPTVYLAHWMEEHCKRLITVLHRYIVHILTTGFHSVTERINDKNQGLELTTPVLEKAPTPWDKTQPLLPVSQVWILAATLPPLYTKPSHHSPTSSTNGFSMQNYLAKILDLSCPSHWTLLYNSLQHGLGANRFSHHVLSYRGPTLTFLRGEQDTEFCIGATQEWQESHLYWGGEESIIIQILPLYHVVQRGPKLLYLNMKIRGYPKGIRAGLDPRKPSLDINDSFTVMTYKGIPYQLQTVEVWGCGTPQSREMQLDIKKWEVKQAERQRVVKLSANEWSDHPDRYLLELAGRPNYSQSNN
uniref:TLDc domain-containing protein n=1 Tax=Cuerna arida TaxID=1464854 RepID=A0A1B6FL81_9HEMI